MAQASAIGATTGSRFRLGDLKLRFPNSGLGPVGKVTEEHLEGAGLRTVGDLQDHAGDLRALVGSWGPELKRFAFGEDQRPLELGDDIKSISSENTFLKDTDDRPTLRTCLREQASWSAAGWPPSRCK